MDFFCSVSVGEKAVVPDTHESGWKNVENETSNKFHGTQSHGAFLIAVGVVLPAEADFAVVFIEAVFEDLALMRRILTEVDANTTDDTIFASNTSSILFRLSGK